MKYKKSLALFLAGLLTVSSMGVAFAAPNENNGNKDKIEISAPIIVADTMYYEGEILEINKTGDDILITVDGLNKYSHDNITFVVTDDTKLNTDVENLKVGDIVGIYHTEKMTRSIPPMTNALAINLHEDQFIFEGTVFNIQDNKNTLMLKANKGHVYKYELPANVEIAKGDTSDIKKGTNIEITNNGNGDVITIIDQENEDASMEDNYFAVMDGEITDITIDEDGEITGILIGDPMYGQYFHINGDTILPDNTLEVGMNVKIGFNGISTMSLPGQSTAEEILIVDEEKEVIKLHAEHKGMITDIFTDEDGNVTGILIGDRMNGHVFHISDETKLPKDGLEIGMIVNIDYNGITTASLPPQSTADKITVESEAIVKEGEITEVRTDEEGNIIGIQIGDPYYGHFFHINEDTILPWQPLEVGMNVKAAFNGVMTMSLPAQSGADVIVIL